MTEYDKIFAYLETQVKNHREHAEINEQNILLIEKILSDIHELRLRVEKIENERKN